MQPGKLTVGVPPAWGRGYGHGLLSKDRVGGKGCKSTGIGSDCKRLRGRVKDLFTVEKSRGSPEMSYQSAKGDDAVSGFQICPVRRVTRNDRGRLWFVHVWRQENVHQAAEKRSEVAERIATSLTGCDCANGHGRRCSTTSSPSTSCRRPARSARSGRSFGKRQKPSPDSR